MKKLNILLFIGMFLISFAVAGVLDSNLNKSIYDFDNTKEVIEIQGEDYPELRIENTFGFGKDVWIGRLKENTDVCGQTCYAINNITISENTELISDIRFKTLQSDGTWIEQPIRGYQFYTRTDQSEFSVDDFEYQCNVVGYDSINKSDIIECSDVKIGSHTQYLPEWLPYNVGEILAPGNYELKLEGSKKPSRTVDWQIKTNGEWLDEWAVWGNISLGATAEVTLNSPADGSTSLTPDVVFNGSANVTNGAGLTNMSLFNNVSGTFQLNQTLENFNLSVTNLAFGETGTVGATTFAGVRIFAHINLSLVNVTLFSTTDAPTRAQLRDSSKAQLQEVFFVGENATFDFDLDANTTYYITADSNGSSFTRRDDITPTFTAGPNINVTGGVHTGGTDTNTFFFMFSFIETSEFVNFTTQTFNSAISGSTLWNIQACDTDGDCGFAPSNFTVNLDAQAPLINLTEPRGLQDFGKVGDNETINWNVTDANLDSCWFDYNGTNQTVTCGDNSTNFVLEEDNLNLTFYANDSVGNEASNFTNWTYTVFQTNQSFNSPVVELSSQDFIINVTTATGISIQSADLIYNGTTFSTADKTTLPGNLFSLSKTINIPSGTAGFISENRTFLWNITSVNETSGVIQSFNSSESEQEVLELEFGLCTPTLNVSILNFTMLNEITSVEINATENATTFQATFAIGASSDNLAKNVSINELSTNVSRFDFCTNDDDNVLFTNMELFYTAVGFSDKNYFLSNATLTNDTSFVNLFLLPEDLSIQFFITVERDLFPLENAVVNVDKFFIGEGLFQTVEIDTTDSDGKFTSFLELDKDYKFTITLDGEVLAIINKTAICEAAPCTITLPITQGSINLLSGLQEAFASNVLYNLSYDAASKFVNFQFIDTTGLATSFRMVITQTLSNETGSTISDQIIFTSSGSMSFNMSGQQGDFRVDTFISRSPDQFLDFITLVINNLPGVTGILGLLFALLLIITIIFGIALKPQLLILSIPLALYLTKLMGIISLSNGAIITVAILAAIAVAFTSK